MATLPEGTEPQIQSSRRHIELSSLLRAANRYARTERLRSRTWHAWTLWQTLPEGRMGIPVRSTSITPDFLYL